MALAFLRRHRSWFYIFLWVVILAFVILYIPGLDPATSVAESTVATVGGHAITGAELQKKYTQQRRQIMAMNGGQIDDAMLERMGFRQQVLSSMVRERIELLEADRLGFVVDDQAVLKQITEDPALQENGRFVGTARLTAFLQQQGMTLAQFEKEVRDRIKMTRLRDVVTDGVTVTDAGVTTEFRRRTELVHAEYVYVPTSTFTAQIQPTDEEVKARFESNKDRFRFPERRVVSYLQVDPVELRATAVPTGVEIEAFYRDNPSQFETPEQVCGRHILFKVKQTPTAAEGHSDADAKAMAEAALARVKAGEAFEKVAKEKSEDNSASNGGSLGCFPREQMVPEFSNAAFSLANGAVSDVVRTQFGYHVIKTDTKIAASKQPIEQVRKRIEMQLQDTKSREMAAEKMSKVADAVRANQSLEQVATAHGLTVKKSDPLLLGKGTGSLTSPLLLSRVFELKAKETAKEAFPAGTGAAFVRLEEVLPAKVPEFAEVKDDVRADLVKQISRDKAKAAALALTADAGRTDLAKAAARAKLTRTETKGLVGQGQALQDVPQGNLIETALFDLPEKTLSAPLDVPGGVVVARVIEKKAYDPVALEQQKETLRQSILDTKKDQLFSAYLQTLTTRYPITQNAEALSNVR